MTIESTETAEVTSISQRLTGLVALGLAGARKTLPVLRETTSVVRPVGWFVLATAVTSWIVGTTFGWEEMLTLAAAAALLLIVCGLFLIGRTDLEVSIELQPQRTTVGLPANGQITVKNSSSGRLLPSRVDLVIGNALASFSTPSLGRGDTHEDLFRIGTDRRGIINVGPAQIVRADPVGVFGRVVSQSAVDLLYVHPKTVKVEGAGAGFLRDLEGRETTDLSPSDLAFHSLREYVPGDDRRHVHWRTSARVGRLMVQQFVDTRRSQVLMILNEELAVYDDEEGFETAVSTIGSIGLQVVRDGQARTVTSGGRLLGSISPSTLLDELSGVTWNRDSDGLAKSVAFGSRKCPDASLVVIVTGKQTTPSELRLAARRFPLATRFVAIRVGAGDSGFQRLENLLLFSIEELDQLSSVMNVVVSS